MPCQTIEQYYGEPFYRLCGIVPSSENWWGGFRDASSNSDESEEEEEIKEIEDDEEKDEESEVEGETEQTAPAESLAPVCLTKKQQ